MAICRECGAPADVRHEYTNEKVLFVYTHGGREHKVWMSALDANEEFNQERVQRLTGQPPSR